MLEPADKAKITKSLDMLVSQFNSDFARWAQEHGCVAQFGWGYDRNGQKKLEIQGIDMIIHRKEAPRAASLEAVMKQYEPETP